jgi:signal transduction histidine kinase
MRPPRQVASRPRLPRPTARLRLTLLYGSLFTLAGAALLGFTYWLFDHATAGNRILQGPPPGSTRILPGSPPGRSIATPGSPPGGRIAGCLAGDPSCQLGAETARHAFDLHALLLQSGIALAVMAVLAFALGWLVAGRVLRPLRTITATARAISATSLHQRLALAGPDDEFSELASTLNDLLARLEASFTAQRNFVASASHELRTPLTLDQTLLELTLRDPDATVERWRECGQDVLQSSRQQERILDALLTLATSQAGLSRRTPADLSKITAARLLAASDQIDSQQLRIRTSLHPAALHGDPDLISRLAANLINNAVQHNIPGGTVTLTTDNQDGHAVLSVANTGPVIPPAQIGRLFEPFQRLTTTRTTNDNGHGLGLSIVAAIATAHGATIATHARPEGGLHIQVSFPASTAHHPHRGTITPQGTDVRFRPHNR